MEGRAKVGRGEVESALRKILEYASGGFEDRYCHWDRRNQRFVWEKSYEAVIGRELDQVVALVNNEAVGINVRDDPIRLLETTLQTTLTLAKLRLEDKHCYWNMERGCFVWERTYEDTFKPELEGLARKTKII